MINTYLSVNDFTHGIDTKTLTDVKNNNNPGFSFDDILKSVKDESENIEYTINKKDEKNIEYKSEENPKNQVERESQDKKSSSHKNETVNNDKNINDNIEEKDADFSDFAEEKHIDNIDNTDKKKLSNKQLIEAKNENAIISDNLKDKQKENIKFLIKNNENSIIDFKDIKNILSSKLKIDDISKMSKDIENIKKYIESLEKNDKKDKKEIEGILIALENMKNILEISLKNDNRDKSSLVKSASAIDSMKRLLNDIDKIKENIKKISKEVKDSSLQISPKENDIKNDELINQDMFKEISKEDGEIKTKDKSKINAEGNIAKETQYTGEDKAEITIAKMKDGDFVDSKAYNNYANNALKSQNRTNMSENILKFQDMMSRLVEKAHFAVNNSRSEVVMSLTPDYLGKVRIKMNMDGDNLTGRIFVDNAEIKDIFTKNIDTVITSLNEVGINIEGFDVMLRQDMPNEKDADDNFFNKIRGNYSEEGDPSEIIIEKYSMPERRLNLFI